MTRLTRRFVLAGGAAALAPLPAAAQGPALQGAATKGAMLGEVAFAARMRALSGFDPLPQPLIVALYAAMRADGRLGALPGEAAQSGSGEAAETEKRALKALYSGIWPGGEGAPPRRLSFAGALQWAAIEETNNVISYCGGLPGFWAEPPAPRG